MSHPDQESLVDLALGDADLNTRHGDHVRGCAACSSFVAEIRRARDLVAGSVEVAEWDQPPADVWNRIERAVDVDAAPAGSGATPPRYAARAARRSRAPWWVAAASVAGIVVGLAFGWAFWNDPARPSPTIARTALDTLDTRQPRGEAALVGTGEALDLRVDTTALDAGSGYLEVWLINRDGKRMVSVGVLRGAGTETFPVSQALIAQGYVVVDISREGYDDKPQHSGDSLARGALPA